MLTDPITALTCVLVLACVLVNGWTDAPNAIATAVATGAFTFRRAALLAAVCNLLGALCVTAFSPGVAHTLFSIARFGDHRTQAISALCAALCAVVLWAVLAWRFGVPTSESHALAAGVAGAALAMPAGTAQLMWGPWLRIVLGLALSMALGAGMGAVCQRVLQRRSPSRSACLRGQRWAAAGMAVLHGAQDGQKFLGILLLGLSLTGPGDGVFSLRMEAVLPCACIMGLGTALGGRRLIDTVGRDMVRIGPSQGLAADLGAGACLLLCTLAGLPVSTTHVKTAAILGAGKAGGSRPSWRVAGRIVLTWLCTFPGCGLLGFFLARLFQSFA